MSERPCNPMTIRWNDPLTEQTCYQALCRGHHWEGPVRTTADMARIDEHHHRDQEPS